MKTAKENTQAFTTNLRRTLKEMMQTELEQLPEILKGLEPKERLNILCRLMPFVIPKVESVDIEEGEPNTNPSNLEWGPITFR